MRARRTCPLTFTHISLLAANNHLCYFHFAASFLPVLSCLSVWPISTALAPLITLFWPSLLRAWLLFFIITGNWLREDSRSQQRAAIDWSAVYPAHLWPVFPFFSINLSTRTHRWPLPYWRLEVPVSLDMFVVVVSHWERRRCQPNDSFTSATCHMVPDSGQRFRGNQRSSTLLSHPRLQKSLKLKRGENGILGCARSSRRKIKLKTTNQTK